MAKIESVENYWVIIDKTRRPIVHTSSPTAGGAMETFIEEMKRTKDNEKYNWGNAVEDRYDCINVNITYKEV